ncbi:hypothetical protein L596_027317 [Steinernema carpocapsae]|uniref:Uncharacterized protein n=1 Tax=Steinernema carpocapsae TaxID=34508 RepID=A0A4U5M5B6_STECR|nr:hypothetical protein L596_027317 [Steinernema carpocapsae]
MKTMSVIALVAICLLAMAGPTVADHDVLEFVKNLDPLKLKSTPLGCPIPIVGKICPAENVFYYFACCRLPEDPSRCCFKPQDWTIVVGLVILGLSIIGIVVNLLRCIFGHR